MLCFAISLAEDRPRPVENGFRNGLTAQDAELRWFSNLLWATYPEARSENDLANRVARELTTSRRKISPRTVRYWLRGDHAPHFRYVMRVLDLARREGVHDFFDGRRQ